MQEKRLIIDFFLQFLKYKKRGRSQKKKLHHNAVTMFLWQFHSTSFGYKRNSNLHTHLFNSLLTSRDLPSKRSHTSRGIRWGPLGVGVVSRPRGATLVPVGGMPCWEDPEPSLWFLLWVRLTLSLDPLCLEDRSLSLKPRKNR